MYYRLRLLGIEKFLLGIGCTTRSKSSGPSSRTAFEFHQIHSKFKVNKMLMGNEETCI